MTTKIEWTDVTDNIIVAEGGGWWCRKISAGCTNCYAAKLNQSSYFHGNKLPYSGEAPPLKLRGEIIKAWKRQRVPKKHFVASMTDVFGEWVEREWQYTMLDGAAMAPKQTIQFLTKRADVMLKAVTDWMWLTKTKEPFKNIWLGFTAENQECFNERWAHMRTLAMLGFTVFVSAEPLLSAIVLPNDFLWFENKVQVIVGGESGTGARPMDLAWMRGIVEQCKTAGVPVFVKQLGSVPIWHGRILPRPDWLPSGTKVGIHSFDDGSCAGLMRLQNRKGGDMGEWPDDLKIREFPEAAYA